VEYQNHFFIGKTHISTFVSFLQMSETRMPYFFHNEMLVLFFDNFSTAPPTLDQTDYSHNNP